MLYQLSYALIHTPKVAYCCGIQALGPSARQRHNPSLRDRGFAIQRLTFVHAQAARITAVRLSNYGVTSPQRDLGSHT